MGGGGFEPPKAEPAVETAGSSSEILLRNGLRWPHIRARARTRARPRGFSSLDGVREEAKRKLASPAVTPAASAPTPDTRERRGRLRVGHPAGARGFLRSQP
jgi:hypothetical protein